MTEIKIPRNIFQTWETKNMSEGLKGLAYTWIEKNPNYNYFFYDKYEREEFIKQNFDMRVLTAYRRMIPGAFKADLFKFCVLYIRGGIFVDIDTICFNSIDIFLNENIEFMTPIDLNNCPSIGTYNLFTSFICSIPKHPILLGCINRIVYNVENSVIHHSNLDFTGPGVLGRSTNVYLKLPEETSFINKYGFWDEGKLFLLCFDLYTEYVKVKDKDDILFQNKNGNPYIQQVYGNELISVNGVDWGKCSNPYEPI